MNDKSFFLLIFITILVFILWFIPIIAINMFPGQHGWSVLYIPIFIISLCWGDILTKRIK